MFAALWQYRHFILASVRGELQARYARSGFGAVWIFLHPLLQAIIYTVVLAGVMGAKLPNVNSQGAYPVYLLAGMSAWGLFTEVMNRSLTIFIDYGAAMKKIAFPRLCLPFIVLGTALINHVVLLGACVVVFACLGHFPNWSWLSILPVCGIIAALAFGFGLVLGVFNVFSRDIGQFMVVLLQMWFWMTPIVYPKEALPEKFQALLNINPITPLVGVYQKAFLQNQWLDPQQLIVPIVLAVVLLWAAFNLFRRAGAEMVDVL